MRAFGPALSCAGLESRFLGGFAQTELEVLLATATERHFHAKTVITVQGDSADHLFLLKKGRTRFFFTTQEGQKIILLWHVPGDIFGVSALLSAPSLYLVSTEATRESCVLVWDRPTIRKLATRYPRLLENGLLTASDYMAWYVAAHAALVSHSARQRLANVLMCLAEVIGHRVPGGIEFDITNEELASAANLTPFTASRILSDWQAKRAVVKRRGKILLRSPDRLSKQTP